MNTFM